MGREVRRVPPNWEHPRRPWTDRYMPLFDGFKKDLADWRESKKNWDSGLVQDYSCYPEVNWKPKPEDYTGSYEEWAGCEPEPGDYMPDWPESERTHYQMYETTSEGTPISPVMETPEELARWLAETGASAFGGITATYEEWLAMIVGPGSAVSAAFTPETGFISGVTLISHAEFAKETP